MILKNLLNEVKYGKKEFDDKKLFEDISSDFVELDENIKYFSASRRLDKLAKKFEKPETEKIVIGVKKVSEKFKSVEEAVAYDELTPAKIRVVEEDIKKEFKKMMNFINERNNMKFLRSNDMLVEIGGITSTILYGLKLLNSESKFMPTLSDDIQKIVDENLKFLSEAEE